MGWMQSNTRVIFHVQWDTTREVINVITKEDIRAKLVIHLVHTHKLTLMKCFYHGGFRGFPRNQVRPRETAYLLLRAIYIWDFVIYLSLCVPTCVPKKQSV
jgi:hypothetical protein